MKDAEAIAKHRRNMNIHLYSIKLSQNNFTTFLYLHKSLNYESSLMRNDFFFKDNIIAFAEKLRNHYNKKEKTERTARSYRTLKR